MTNWLAWFDSAFKDYLRAQIMLERPNKMFSKPLAVFQDSYEYHTDWSPDFFAQFEKRRGYKLQNELPSLFGDDQSERAARVKYDYRRTLAEIMAEQSEPAWIDWAHKNGFSAIYQAPGTPGNWLDLYADADMPEMEMFHNDRSILISKFASSAAHVSGKNLTGAETGTWMKEHFTETLADVKYLADDMFLSGVNRIFYHGACYSPDDAPWPGWLFYASTEMNPRNPVWHDVDAVNAYIARVQSVLQSGKPDNDILLYWPVADFWTNPNGLVQKMGVSETDWFKNQPIGKTAQELWDKGYAFDYVSDAQLQTAKVVGGKIQMPGGDYKTIVVPECKFMPLETFKQLLSLAENGATIIFEKGLPGDMAGANNSEQQRSEFHRISSQIKPESVSDISAPNWKHQLKFAKVGKGLLELDDLELSFAAPSVAPESFSKEGISFVRRSFNGGWNYFIADRSDKNFDGWILLARPAQDVEILNPMTGNLGRVAQNENGQIHLQLAAGESLILRAFDHPLPQLDSLPAWNYFQTNGAPTEISGTWNVRFISGGPTLPADSQRDLHTLSQ